MRNKRLGALVLSVFVFIFLFGCSASPSPAKTPALPSAAADFPLTVQDDSGQTLVFNGPPQRIISLSPGNTEILYALGKGSSVIVTDKYSDYPQENTLKAKLTTYPKPNIEELVSLQPDLIIVLVEATDFIQQMKSRGIKVLKLFPEDFDRALENIELLGRITGAQSQAKQITDDMRRRASAVISRTKSVSRPRVLYELDASDETRPFVAGSTGFFANLVPLAGGRNIFDDLGAPSGRVSTEQIVARDPEIIILGDATLPYSPQTPEMVKSRLNWGGITAVKSGRIYTMNDAWLSRAGPRLVDGLEAMAKLLHPELFP